jgi:biopolymer transport protein ExbD
MGMQVGSGAGDDEPMMEMNMTPLIDVMLVLIIMLIITIPTQNHAINLSMANSTASQPVKPPVVATIDINADGTVLWDKARVEDRKDLEHRLTQIAAQPDQPEVHLRPNKMAAYKSVAAVMASAQRLGVTKIGMIDDE